jgi:hypothetical protein
VGWVTEDIPASGSGSLLHTAAAGHGTAWAFGINASQHRPFGTLVFRRDETGWQQVEVPVIGRANRAVVCSPTEVWVVGDGQSLHGVGDEWRALPTAHERDQLFSVVTFGPEVWTAGYLPGDRGGTGTVQRWDGDRWVAFTLPDVAPSWSLAGLDGVAADDVWAVGAVHGENGPPALHWDGSTWESVPMPGNGTGRLDEVLALASDDVWASGYWTSAGRDRFPLLVHWDGTAWSVATVPDGPAQVRELVVVDGRPHGVGYDDGVPYIIAWDGGEWQRVDAPAVPADAKHCFLHGASTLPDGGLLVVGAVHLSQSEARPFAAVSHGEPPA